jgi:hypothetical protein
MELMELFRSLLIVFVRLKIHGSKVTNRRVININININERNSWGCLISELWGWGSENLSAVVDV